MPPAFIRARLACARTTRIFPVKTTRLSTSDRTLLGLGKTGRSSPSDSECVEHLGSALIAFSSSAYAAVDYRFSFRATPKLPECSPSVFNRASARPARRNAYTCPQWNTSSAASHLSKSVERRRVECVELDTPILETLPGDSEIGDLETAARGDQHVLRSQVPMNDSSCVKLLESAQECDHLDSRLALAESS